jgi:ATP-dependent DNA helicase RecQ
MIHLKNNNNHFIPNHLVYHLTHRDINLGYFSFIQRRLNLLSSGDTLNINEKGLTNLNGEQIVKFSKSFQLVKESLVDKGYLISESKVRFVLFWKSNNENTNDDKELKIVLPELVFERI